MSQKAACTNNIGGNIRHRVKTICNIAKLHRVSRHNKFFRFGKKSICRTTYSTIRTNLYGERGYGLCQCDIIAFTRNRDRLERFRFFESISKKAYSNLCKFLGRIQFYGECRAEIPIATEICIGTRYFGKHYFASAALESLGRKHRSRKVHLHRPNTLSIQQVARVMHIEECNSYAIINFTQRNFRNHNRMFLAGHEYDWFTRSVVECIRFRLAFQNLIFTIQQFILDIATLPIGIGTTKRMVCI